MIEQHDNNKALPPSFCRSTPKDIRLGFKGLGFRGWPTCPCRLPSPWPKSLLHDKKGFTAVRVRQCVSQLSCRPCIVSCFHLGWCAAAGAFRYDARPAPRYSTASIATSCAATLATLVPSSFPESSSKRFSTLGLTDSGRDTTKG